MTPKEKAEQMNRMFIDKDTILIFINQVINDTKYINDYDKRANEIYYWDNVIIELNKL